MNVVFTPQAVSISANAGGLSISTGSPVTRDYIEDRDPYEGDYTIVPSTEEQVLRTQNLYMTENLKIAPIPQNYGLITWDGATLTVS